MALILSHTILVVQYLHVMFVNLFPRTTLMLRHHILPLKQNDPKEFIGVKHENQNKSV